MGIFDKRVNYKPFEYPEVKVFIEAMNKSFWVESEVEWEPSIQDFKLMDPVKREIFVRAVLSIAQVEVAVKAFWGELYQHFPKPEFNNLGSTFAESETRHSEAYSRALDELSLNERFIELLEVPAFKAKLDLIEKVMKDPSIGIESKLLFFTLVIENSSLFGYFAISTSFARFDGKMKNLSNMISWSAIDENCFPEGTRILTPLGWKTLSSIKIGDEVYGFKEGELRIENVTNTIKKPFKGTLIKTGNSKLSITTTPDHDMIINNKGKWEKVKAVEAKYRHKKVPVTSNYISNTGDYKLTPLDRLRIAIQADGSRLYWVNSKGEKVSRGKSGGASYSVNLYKERKIERFRGIVKDLKGSIDITENPIKKGGVEFKIKIESEEDLKKLDWVFKTDILKSKSGAFNFIEEIVEWDGSRKYMCYSSTDKDCVEVIEHAAILAGYRTSIYESNDKKRSENYKNTYKVNFYHLNKGCVSSNSYLKEEVLYDGDVHCVTVPSGGIVVKQGDKSPYITGNCHSEAGIWLLNEIQKEKSIFEDINIKDTVEEYVRVESDMLDWIFEEGELEFFTKDNLLDYIKYRIDTALAKIGFDKVFNMTDEQVKPLFWFEEQVYADDLTDFFASRPTAYTKHDKSFTGDDLF